MTNFYQSPSDKARFDVLLKVLGEEGPNLAIIGDDEVALAHYGRAIHQQLNQLPHTQVELWGAVDSEKLVSRFNDILSELTLEQLQQFSDLIQADVFEKALTLEASVNARDHIGGTSPKLLKYHNVLAVRDI